MADDDTQDDEQQPLDVQENDDGSADVSLPEGSDDETENEDGSVTIKMEFKGPAEDADFYTNLADGVVDNLELGRLALDYLELIERDKEDREQRDKQQEEGLRRTGMGNEAPGGAAFQGASKVVHPVMAEACVDFASRAIKELFPPDGPVRTKILGEVTDEKTARAERKRDFNNWQLTEQIEEFRDEEEQLLTQLPLGGSQYMLWYYDDYQKRPCVEFAPIDKVIIPFSAANFYTSQRVAHEQDITEQEMQARVTRGLYVEAGGYSPADLPEPTKSEKANRKIEGKEPSENIDGMRRVYHIYTWLELEDDKRTRGARAPYILMVDDTEHRVLGLYRNWEEGDKTTKKLDWMVEFRFIPWRGAMAAGLPMLIGGLSGAATGALRALLDSALINSVPTLLKIKGAKISGQTDQIEPTEIKEIEGAPGIDDIRKLAMPMPFNQPSPVLLQLLGICVEAAKGVVTTSEEKIADATSQMPVGTTQALIEQGAAVFSAVHARLHRSQARCLQILNRINRWYLDDMEKGDIVADLPVVREDFARNSDVIPVSDPHIFSETQRVAQNQSVLQLAQMFPDKFDVNKVLFRVLSQLKIPNINELLPNAPEPVEVNAAEENIAMTLGHLAFAYPGQDHVAHLMTHIAFAADPCFGASQLMAPSFVPSALEHCKQHMLLWYHETVTHYATQGTRINISKYDDAKMTKPIDQLVYKATQHVTLDAKEVFQAVLPGIAHMQQVVQQLSQAAKQNTPPDPASQAMLQASMAETQRRAARDQQDGKVAQLKLVTDTTKAQKEREVSVAMNAEDNLTKERIEAAKLNVEQTADQQALAHEQQRTAMEFEARARDGLQDESQLEFEKAKTVLDHMGDRDGQGPEGGAVGGRPAAAPQRGGRMVNRRKPEGSGA